jgi:methylthioribose-1-phosphate isomerase
MLKTLEWTGRSLRLLDQTKLPTETVYVDITDEKQMWDAIKRLVVRGAPAIGVAAAFGAYLGVRDHGDEPIDRFIKRLDSVCDYLASSRPTAVNLFWALDRIRALGHSLAAGTSAASPVCHTTRDVLDGVLNECLEMLEEDNVVCHLIGEHGAKLLEKLQNADGQVDVLTHCNAGGLATVCYGTALAPIYVGAERGLKFHVFADETRPLLQGSRITAYELQENGIPVTVICDNMAATVMGQGKVKAVIVGTDRVAANGDVANKIGTHGVAILARHFGIPFYVAAPTSSIDLTLTDGSAIPIEQRDPREVSHGLGRQITPNDVDIFNPAFDVTPHNLVTAIISEEGVVTAPYAEGLSRVVQAAQRRGRALKA